MVCALSFTLNAFKSHKQSSVRIEFLFQIFLFLISPFPFLAYCHMFYWWPVHWYGWLVQAVGDWPLIWAIKGLALAIWGSRHTANAFMRARISDRRVTKQSDGRICYTRLYLRGSLWHCWRTFLNDRKILWKTLLFYRRPSGGKRLFRQDV